MAGIPMRRFETLWGALMCSETLEGVLKRSEVLWDALWIYIYIYIYIYVVAFAV